MPFLPLNLYISILLLYNGYQIFLRCISLKSIRCSNLKLLISVIKIRMMDFLIIYVLASYFHKGLDLLRKVLSLLKF